MKETIGKSLLASILVIIVGILLLFFGIKSVKTYKENKENYIETTATVIDYYYPGLSDEGAQIVVEYEVNSQKYTAKSNYKTTSPKSIGEKITILYNPSKPEEAIFPGGSNYIIVSVGAVFTLVGLLLLYKTFDLKNKSNNIKYDQTDINNVIGPNNN